MHLSLLLTHWSSCAHSSDGGGIPRSWSPRLPCLGDQIRPPVLLFRDSAWSVNCAVLTWLQCRQYRTILVFPCQCDTLASTLLLRVSCAITCASFTSTPARPCFAALPQARAADLLFLSRGPPVTLAWLLVGWVELVLTGTCPYVPPAAATCRSVEALPRFSCSCNGLVL